MPVISHNGEPGCQTPLEINQFFRNNWDPTSYWYCERHGEPAQERRCQPNQLFSDAAKKCVDWREWRWSEPKEPPSRPEKLK